MFRNRLHYLFVLIGMLLLAACGYKTADVKGYLKYMADRDNGLMNVKEMDGLVVEVKYLTPEAMALNEMKDLHPDKAKFNEVLSDYKGFSYFNVSIKSKDSEHIYQLLSKEGIDSHGLEDYLNYKAQHDFYLVADNDTAKCTLYSYSQTYALAKQFDIAIGFENADSLCKADKVLEFDATQFNRGLLKFVFSKNDINNVPALAL